MTYNSVRLAARTCYALFSPSLINHIIQTTHYEYSWDGEKIVVALETTEVVA